jgi:hypothetical protein
VFLQQYQKPLMTSGMLRCNKYFAWYSMVWVYIWYQNFTKGKILIYVISPIYFTGWCFFLTWTLFFHILGMSPSQLTNIFQRGWNHQRVIKLMIKPLSWLSCWISLNPEVGNPILNQYWNHRSWRSISEGFTFGAMCQQISGMTERITVILHI